MQGTTGEDREKHNASFEGVIPNLQRRWEKTDSEYVKARLHAYLSEQRCRKCKGSRLQPEALSVRIAYKNIHEVVQMTIDESMRYFDDLNFAGEAAHIAEQVLKEIKQRLGFLVDVGLGYLTLDRPSATLSGGEAQRIRLATQVGSGLVGVCYVLDEPTIGLHSRDNEKLIRTLRRLADMGNSVLVVEHDEEAIRAADYVIDVGPGPGAHGGEIIAHGTLEQLAPQPQVDHGQVPKRRLHDPRADAPPQRRSQEGHRIDRLPRAQPQEHQRPLSAGGVPVRDRRVRQRQEHAGQPDAAERPEAPPVQQQGQARRRTTTCWAPSRSTRSSRSTSRRSARRPAATRPPTPACST